MSSEYLKLVKYGDRGLHRPVSTEVFIFSILSHLVTTNEAKQSSGVTRMANSDGKQYFILGEGVTSSAQSSESYPRY